VALSLRFIYKNLSEVQIIKLLFVSLFNDFLIAKVM